MPLLQEKIRRRFIGRVDMSAAEGASVRYPLATLPDPNARR